MDNYFFIPPILGRIRDGKVKDKQLFYGSKRKRAGLYTGPVVKLHPHGFGIIKFGTICTLEGEWKEGKIDGPAVQIFSNGSKFEGELKDDAGFALFTMYHGQGKTCFENGDVYEDEYKNGKRNGYGKFFFNTGEIYLGKWKNDKKVGNGILILIVRNDF